MKSKFQSWAQRGVALGVSLLLLSGSFPADAQAAPFAAFRVPYSSPAFETQALANTINFFRDTIGVRTRVIIFLIVSALPIVSQIHTTSSRISDAHGFIGNANHPEGGVLKIPSFVIRFMEWIWFNVTSLTMRFVNFKSRGVSRSNMSRVHVSQVDQVELLSRSVANPKRIYVISQHAGVFEVYFRGRQVGDFEFLIQNGVVSLKLGTFDSEAFDGQLPNSILAWAESEAQRFDVRSSFEFRKVKADTALGSQEFLRVDVVLPDGLRNPSAEESKYLESLVTKFLDLMRVHPESSHAALASALVSRIQLTAQPGKVGPFAIQLGDQLVLDSRIMPLEMTKVDSDQAPLSTPLGAVVSRWSMQRLYTLYFPPQRNPSDATAISTAIYVYLLALANNKHLRFIRNSLFQFGFARQGLAWMIRGRFPNLEDGALLNFIGSASQLATMNVTVANDLTGAQNGAAWAGAAFAQFLISGKSEGGFDAIRRKMQTLPEIPDRIKTDEEGPPPPVMPKPDLSSWRDIAEGTLNLAFNAFESYFQAMIQGGRPAQTAQGNMVRQGIGVRDVIRRLEKLLKERVPALRSQINAPSTQALQQALDELPRLRQDIDAERRGEIESGLSKDLFMPTAFVFLMHCIDPWLGGAAFIFVFGPLAQTFFGGSKVKQVVPSGGWSRRSFLELLPFAASVPALAQGPKPQQSKWTIQVVASAHLNPKLIDDVGRKLNNVEGLEKGPDAPESRRYRDSIGAMRTQFQNVLREMRAARNQTIRKLSTEPSASAVGIEYTPSALSGVLPKVNRNFNNLIEMFKQRGIQNPVEEASDFIELLYGTGLLLHVRPELLKGRKIDLVALEDELVRSRQDRISIASLNKELKDKHIPSSDVQPFAKEFSSSFDSGRFPTDAVFSPLIDRLGDLQVRTLALQAIVMLREYMKCADERSVAMAQTALRQNRNLIVVVGLHHAALIRRTLQGQAIIGSNSGSSGSRSQRHPEMLRLAA